MNDLNLLNTAGAKIKYLSKQQEIISQNVANADTPGYVPKQLTRVDFGSMLGKSLGTKNPPIHLGLSNTNPTHMSPNGMPNGTDKKQSQKITYEVAPAGNAVILEEQMVKASETRMDYNLMINLYNKNMGLLRTAIGVPR